MKDVFAGLGSGLVKCTNTEMKGGREVKPDFERQQMERSGGWREEKRGRRGVADEEEDDGFKRTTWRRKPGKTLALGCITWYLGLNLFTKDVICCCDGG